MRFNLKKPCKDCPFIKGTSMVLRPGRMASIARDLRNDYVVFPCHKTTTHDGDGKPIHTDTESACAGALAYQAKHLQQIPILARLAIRRGEITQDDIAKNFATIEDPGKWKTE